MPFLAALTFMAQAFLRAAGGSGPGHRRRLCGEGCVQPPRGAVGHCLIARVRFQSPVTAIYRGLVVGNDQSAPLYSSKTLRVISGGPRTASRPRNDEQHRHFGRSLPRTARYRPHRSGSAHLGIRPYERRPIDCWLACRCTARIRVRAGCRRR